MAKTPESIESRYQTAKTSAKKSMERAYFNAGLTIVGLAGFFADMAIVSQTYYVNVDKSNEQIIREIEEDRLDSYTQEALIASISIVGFEAFSAASAIAGLGRAFQSNIYSREASKLQKGIEAQSKRPPSLRS